MQHTETVSVEKTYSTCDFCVESNQSKWKCYGCEKDLCYRHRCFAYNDPWNDQYLGDTSLNFCSRCYELLEPFSERARAIQEEANFKIEALKDAWKQALKAG